MSVIPYKFWEIPRDEGFILGDKILNIRCSTVRIFLRIRISGLILPVAIENALQEETQKMTTTM